MKPPRWGPILTAFTIWFAHFMACWAAAEIWPHQWPAHALAWGATAAAWAALGVHLVRANARRAAGEMAAWSHRFVQGATALSAVAVLFRALPSLLFRP
jgi:ferric-dicitrate binding protein FerR (iron transport regulator)